MEKSPRSFWREIAPVEHGAWGLFLIPLAVGAGVCRSGYSSQVLLGLSTLGVFLMRRPALRWLRAFNRESLDSIHTLWPGKALAFCVSLTLAAALPLLWMGHWYLILVSAIAAGLMVSEVYLASSRSRYPFLSELVEVWVLSLLAPSAYYVGTGKIDETAAILWLLCAIYFSVSVADIRVRLGRFHAERGVLEEAVVEERTMQRLVTFWIGMAGALLVVILTPRYRLALWSLAPLFIRPFVRRKWPITKPADISSLGWSEVLLSLVFAVLAIGLV